MAAPRYLLFDFDGTLVDSSSGILASFAGALAKCGRRPAVALEQSLIGPPLRETIRKASACDDDMELDGLIAAFKEDYDTSGYLGTRAYPGIASMLANLQAAGTELFIVTNKRHLPTTRILKHLEWTDLFKGVYSLDAVIPAVADKAELVAHILAKESIDPTQALMVGDTPEDYRAASRNGVRFAAALWGYGLLDDAEPYSMRLRSSADLANLQ